jgi:hypothetical protein
MNGAKTQLLSARFQGCFQASQVSSIGYRQKTIVLDGTLEMVIGLVMGVPERKLDFVVAWLLKLARLLSHDSEIEEQHAILGSGDLNS